MSRGDGSLEAVLWDMDGTLVRTEELWKVAEERTMAAFGSYWDAQDQAVAIGGPLDRVVRYMATRVQRPQPEVAERIVAEIEHLMRSEHVPWMPGAKDLHDALTNAGIPQALVSNSWRELMDVALDELHTSFDVTIAGDEVTHPKPDPLPYLRALELLGASPEHSVVLEDSPTGVTAALQAGCWVIGVPHVSELPPDARMVVVDSLREVNVEFLQAVAAGQHQGGNG